MQVICPGCGATFKHSGLSHHIRQSKDLRCHLNNPGQQIPLEVQDDNPLATPVSGPGVTNAAEDEPQNRSHLSVDPSGDLFGDYADYVGLNFGVDDEGDQDDMDDDVIGDVPESPTDIQEEEEAMLQEALLAEEHRLEPERPVGGPDVVEQEAEDAPSEHHNVPLRLRGGFERPLSNCPEIMEFSDWNAGAVYERAHQNGNLDYRQAISTTESPNPYAPFSSRLDWEIARWAKMRGPGSNSLTELLRIEGVRFPTNGSKIRSDLLIVLIRWSRGLA